MLVKASYPIFEDVYGCLLVKCQARGMNSHSRIVFQSIIQAADVRIQLLSGDPIPTSAAALWHCFPLGRVGKIHSA